MPQSSNTNRHFNTPGHAHELTFSCYHHQNFLSDPEVCTIFLQELRTAQNELSFDLWAYVLMPDHVHLLIWPREEDYDIALIGKSTKGRTAKRYLRSIQESGKTDLVRFSHRNARGDTSLVFWQRGGGFDRNLWSAESIHSAIRYIEANPVRKGLVGEPREWKWSSAYEAGEEEYRPVVCRRSVPVILL